jgi:hypothetical protein
VTIHPRERAVDDATIEITTAVLAASKAHGLTAIERLQILNHLAADCLKYALRRERPPDDPGRPAGLE